MAAKKRLASREAPNDVLAQIARRAYELYVWRGREDGHDRDDWLQAEAEIIGEAARAASA